MMFRKFSLIVAGLFVMLGLNTATNAVMIDINGDNGPTAAGWEAFNQASDNAVVDVGPVTYLDAFGAGQNFSLHVVMSDGPSDPGNLQARWKNDSAVAGTPAAMWQDWGGQRRMDILDLVMTMPEGPYDFTLYYSTNDGGAAVTPPGGSAQAIQSDDTAATFSDSFTVGTGETGATISIENQAGGPFRLHGLEVTLVPEPASMALLGLGGLAALIRRRR